MGYGRVILIRHEVEMDGDVRVAGGPDLFSQVFGVRFHHARDLARGKTFLADADINVDLSRKVRSKYLGPLDLEQRTVVPPKARTDDDVLIEQVWSFEQYLGRNQAAEPLADDCPRPVGPVTLFDVGLEFLFDKRDETGGTAGDA